MLMVAVIGIHTVCTGNQSYHTLVSHMNMLAEGINHGLRKPADMSACICNNAFPLHARTSMKEGRWLTVNCDRICAVGPCTAPSKPLKRMLPSTKPDVTAAPLFCL